jgi:hypothetical protein
MFPNVRKSTELSVQTVAVGSAGNSGRWKDFTQKRERATETTGGEAERFGPPDGPIKLG